MELRIVVDSALLDKVVATLPDLLADVVAVAAHNVESRAKAIIVEKRIIDTGATLNSTQARRVEGDRFAWRVGPTTEYAPFLEFGTTRMAARPFMVPAAEAEREPFNNAVKAVIEKAAG